MPIAPVLTTVVCITMPKSNPAASGIYHGLPTLSHDNFNEWKIQVIMYLTSVADHVWVILHHPNALSVVSNPRHPVNATEAAEWDMLECMAFGVIISTASKLHDKIILLHCDANRPIYKLWVKICSMHQL